MASLLKILWRKLGSLNLTIALCALLTADLVFAYFTVKKNLPTFAPLSEVGLYRWLVTYGLHSLDQTFWFLLLLLLLTLLGVNTAVCATERVLPLLKKEARRPGWVRRLGPHIMHYAVLTILIGYLGSYALSSSLPGQALKSGYSLRLPEGGVIAFLGFDPVYYRGERLDFFRGYMLDPGARLELTGPDGGKREARLAFSRPVRFQGYDIHLIDFYPRKENRADLSGGGRIKLIMRRDPSSAIYLAGLALFSLGLALYAFDHFSKNRRRQDAR
ncbi:MAG: hypothetical protein LBS31_04320 [Candidatus Adiutrix sp.]|jgi:hypothetical protein|nr:hypothetical protein [Candidatus Adiutrix sp.]